MSRSKSEHYKKNQVRACTTLKRREITKNYAFNFDIRNWPNIHALWCRFTTTTRFLQFVGFFNANHIFRCCFLKQKRYLSIEMRKQKRNGFWRYRNSIMVLTYLLNIPGRAMLFGILKAHILKLELTAYSLWTRKRNHADIHAQKKKKKKNLPMHSLWYSHLNSPSSRSLILLPW